MFDRIKDLANIKGVSLTEVASNFGFSSVLLYQWKRASPKVKNLEAVADYFGIFVDYILGREEKNL